MAQKDQAMNTATSNTVALVGRILLAWLFIPAGLLKLTAFSGQVAYAQSVGMPMPEVGVAIGLLIELLGGILLLVGFKTRCAAAVLAVFTLAAGVLFHAYWSVPADQVMITKILFDKNVAIAGGLMAFVAFGAGSFSMDAKRNRL